MNVRRLFVASCLSLLTTSMVFAIRGDIEADLSTAFHLTKEQIGLVWGPAFWGFTLAILASELIRAMQLSGTRSIADITPDLVAPSL